uniref:Uncharacterized protein n=1 Tax=Lotus japonicus TaxID=34305 RepID=I3T8J7_LOTJA|nr:unknown [Lotus japonicus]
MSRWKISSSNVLCSLVRQHSIFSRSFSLITNPKLSQVPMIIPFHLVIENFGFTGRSRRDEIGIQKVEDASTDVGKLNLHLGSVILHKNHMVVVLPTLLLLLNRRDDPPRRTEGADDVLALR